MYAPRTRKEAAKRMSPSDRVFIAPCAKEGSNVSYLGTPWRRISPQDVVVAALCYNEMRTSYSGSIAAVRYRHAVAHIESCCGHCCPKGSFILLIWKPARSLPPNQNLGFCHRSKRHENINLSYSSSLRLFLSSQLPPHWEQRPHEPFSCPPTISMS